MDSHSPERSPRAHAQSLHDAARLAALARTGVSDSRPEPSFDRLAGLAGRILRAPIALVSLVAADRQLFKGCVGLPEPWASLRETSLEYSFCQHVVRTGEPLVIDDARRDPQVKDNRAIAEMGVLAYLGIPLETDGQRIGSFCVIDTRPRAWTADEVELLRDLAGSVVTEIELRAEHLEIARQRAASDEARRRFQVTLSSIGDAVIATDAAGRITFMNPVAAKLCGWTEAEALGKPLSAVFRIVDPQGRQVLEDPVARAIAQGEAGTPAEEAILIARDGTERPIEPCAAPIKDAQSAIQGVVLVFRDILEKKAAGRRLSAYEARFRLIFESVKDFSIFTTDLDGIITSWNRGAENVFGYRESEAIGRPVAIIYTPEDRAAGVPKRELRAADANHGNDERWHLRKDGIRLFASGMVTPLQDEAGTHIGFTKVCRDITAAKQADDLLRAQAAMLKDNDRRKDEFLAMLAHELRNPLGAISSAIQLVQTVQQPEMLTQLREMMHDQVMHLTRLIDDLLDVSRITLGKIELKNETVELGTIISRALEPIRPLLTARQHELTVSLPEAPVRLVVDSTRTVQILGNLLTNAAKYSDPGASIRLSAAVAGDEVVFCVRDDGFGISPEMLPKVFGLFTQDNAHLDRSQGGLGIGLTLVKNLVEMHGGTVSAASEGKGKGSEFTVRLPIGKPAAEAAAPPAPSTRAPRLGTGRILVVDDNRETAKLTARLLKHYGYQVETAHDGNSAIERTRAFRPTVILLDIGLPGMDGYEVARALRQEESGAAATLIAISGHGEAQYRERSDEAGFAHHLIKPLDFAQLISLLQN